MSKNAYYIYFVHIDRDEWEESIKERINHRLDTMKIDPTYIKYISGIDEIAKIKPWDSEEWGICLYLGSEKAVDSSKCIHLIKSFKEKSVPIFPIVEYQQVAEQLPDIIKSIDAFLWGRNGDGPGEVAIQVLGALGITTRERKVFISYKRTDGKAAAEQLFIGLNKQGFDVFKDDCKLDPGVNFEDEIIETLEEMAFLVLLETPEAHGSKNVENEILYAVENLLGVLVLRFPNTEKYIAPAQGLPDLKLDEKDLIPDEINDGLQKFVPEVLKNILKQIEIAHIERIHERNQLIYQSIIKKLSISNPRRKYEERKNWKIILRGSKKNNRKLTLVGITGRTPNIFDIYELDKLECPPYKNVERVLVHHCNSISSQKMDLNYWGMKSRKIRLVHIEDFLEEI